jgi:F-type H+-transporting ATPase subunit b
VENATTQAYLQKETIENESKTNARKILEDAQRQAVQLKQSIKLENEKQVLDIAFDAAEALLQRNLDKKDNEKIVKEFLNKLAKNKKENGN